jgi:hypothetical protein
MRRQPSDGRMAQWHVVLYQGENGTGNLGHYDASWANVVTYWHATESVKIYINRTAY